MSGHDVAFSGHSDHSGNGDHQNPPDKTTVQNQAIASKLISASFGEIVTVLLHAKEYRDRTLAEIGELVVPALLTHQFMVAEGRSKASGFSAPVGAVFWACVSPEVDERLSTNLVEPIKLKHDEWRSGDRAWVIDAVGSEQIVGPLLQRLRQTVLAGKAVKLRTFDQNGVPHVRMLPQLETIRPANT